MRATRTSRVREASSSWWLLLLGSLLIGCGNRQETGDLANVLLITLDTTRADRLGCYGYGRETSPRIDALAAEGALFERCMAQATVTPVSHASILTGQDPYRHGLRFLHGNHGYDLPERAVTLAETLSDRGYRTAAFVSAFPAGRRFGLHQGFHRFDDQFGDSGDRPDDDSVSEAGVVNTGAQQRTARATNQAITAYLDGTPGEPLFLWAHYFDPHDTNLVPEDVSWLRRFRGEDRTKKARALDYYDAEIAYMDHHIGELVDRLRSAGRPLLIAIVGDHGEGHGDHDWWSHGLLYDEQARVPFLLTGPGVPAGSRILPLVRSIDLVPTLLGLLGIPREGALRDLDGIDLGPLLRGEVGDPDLLAYAESTTLDMSYVVPHAEGVRNRKDDQLFSLTRGRWKYIHHRQHPELDELYDLERDPGETVNRLREQAELVAKFRRRLEQLDPYPQDPNTGTPRSAADLEKLKALGYLGGSAGRDG